MCRQLGFPGAEEITAFNSFPGATGDIWMDEVRCLGKETALSQCAFDGWANHNCGHAEDVGITCQPEAPANGGTKAPTPALPPP